MIDSDLIEQLPPQPKTEVVNAIRVITRSGLIQQQEARLLKRLVEGHESEEAEAMVPRIKKYRSDVAALRSFLELGQTK